MILPGKEVGEMIFLWIEHDWPIDREEIEIAFFERDGQISL